MVIIHFHPVQEQNLMNFRREAFTANQTLEKKTFLQNDGMWPASLCVPSLHSWRYLCNRASSIKLQLLLLIYSAVMQCIWIHDIILCYHGNTSWLWSCKHEKCATDSVLVWHFDSMAMSRWAQSRSMGTTDPSAVSHIAHLGIPHAATLQCERVFWPGVKKNPSRKKVE